ncbi:hypothetical protein OIU79_013262 [Salix purpurea]|uniref:Uncharacterized protein n=1 Tax=Salix purpurea TaxID=77065 RepID=A0A9Q0T4E9_SALPP|nr:hypothetical protein OIU79_013262 [Salix purpurea]
MGNEGKRVQLDFQYFMPGQERVFGKDMACVHMKLIAASVIERFKIQLQKKEKHPVHPLSSTLKIKGGLQEIVKERDAWT